MDPKLLASYHAPQRPPVFLAARPATSARHRRYLPYAFAAGLAVVSFAVTFLILTHG